MNIEETLTASLDAIHSGAVVASRETLPTTRQLDAVHRELDREVTHARRWRAFWVMPIKEV